jgi:hypothetical protein
MDCSPTVLLNVAVGLLAVTLWSLPAEASQEGRNLLTNGDFEKELEGWEFHAHGKVGQCVVDPNEHHDGKPVLRIENASPDDSFLRQRVVVRPKTSYRLSGWIKTNDVGDMDPRSATGASLSIEGGFLKTESLTKTQPWKHVTLDFTTRAETEITVGPRLGHYGRKMSGTAWFAEVTLEEVKTNSYQSVVLADRPRAYFRLGQFDDTDTVADEAGLTTGTYMNRPNVGAPGAVASDPNGAAVSLARDKSQYVELTNLGNYGSSLSDGFTVEYWLKTGNATDHQTIFGTANGPDFATDFLADIGYEDGTKRLRMYCRDNHWNRFEVDFHTESHNIEIFNNRWHHIVHVYDPTATDSNEQARLYIDGTRQTVSIFRRGEAPKLSNFRNPMTVGAMNLRGTICDHLDGSLAELAFYDRPLSAAQITAHYRAAKN